MTDKDVCRVFADNLNRIMIERNLKQADIVRALSVGKSTVSGWCKGLNVPRTPALSKLVDYLRVDVSDLMCPPPRYIHYNPSIQQYSGGPPTRLLKENENCYPDFTITRPGHLPYEVIVHDNEVNKMWGLLKNVAMLSGKKLDAVAQIVYLISNNKALTLEEMDYLEFEKIFRIVAAYQKADQPIKEIINTALKPYDEEASDEALLGRSM